MEKYTEEGDHSVSLELTGTEWAVALDSLKRAEAHPDPRYRPGDLACLAKVIRKFKQAREQLRRSS